MGSSPKIYPFSIIWDMDGTLADTQYQHATIESELFKKEGIDITPEVIIRECASLDVYVLCKYVFEKYNRPSPSPDFIKKFYDTKWEQMSMISNNDIQPVSSAIEKLVLFNLYNIPMIIASSSPRFFIKKVIEALGMDRYIPYYVGGDEVKNGKPAPDIFLKAAEVIRTTPNKCLVVEDGRAGIIGAREAGMKTIGLVNDTTDPKYPADIKVANLSKITIYLIEHLFGLS